MNPKITPFPAAVVFDLDGTLIDSAPDLHAALNRLLEGEGRRSLTLHEVVMMIGDGIAKLVERGYQATGEIPDRSLLERKVEQFSNDYEKRATELTVMFPGVRAALDILVANHVVLGICTNKPQSATIEVLKYFNLENTFKTVVGGDQLGGIRKPDSRHLVAALEGLGVTSEEAIMVGDSPNDIAVAKNTGVRSVAVSFGYSRIPVSELGATRIVDHFDNLAKTLCEIA